MEHESSEHSSFETPSENERPAKRRRTSTQPAREVGLMRSPTDRFTGFVGSASGIFFIRSVYGAIDRSQPTPSVVGATPGSDIVPGEDDHLPLVKPDSSGRLWREGEINLHSPSTISFQDLVALSASYFANWHPFYPFLHAPTVLEYFDEFSRSGLPGHGGLEDLRKVIIRAILSTSLADHRQSGGHGDLRYPASLVFQTYDSAVDSLRGVLSRPTTVLALQASLSVQIFLISMLRLNAASRLGGLMTRMAVQLGLHRCPARFASFSSSDRELRQRVFWSIYALDRFLSQSMGLPLSLHDNDVDVCYPHAEYHLQTELENGSKLHLLHLLAQQARLRGEIIELRNKSIHHVDNDPDRATAITAKLSQWWNDVNDYIDPDSLYGASPYATTILTLLRHESIISFYRPILAASRKDAAYDVALQQCISSARSIISNLHSAISSHASLRAAAPPPLALLWPSCTWAVWISTFIMFYAANGKHVAHDVVERLASKSLEILQHLSRRGSAWPEASSAAIRDLRARMAHRSNHDASNTTNDAFTTAPESIIQPPSAPLDTLHPEDTSCRNPDPPENAPGINVEIMRDAGRYGFEFGLDTDYWNTPVTTETNGDFMLGHTSGPDPFSGFDIPFWFDQDQHWDFSQ